MEKQKCPWNEYCRNSDQGCYAREPENCIRFMPLEGTNLIDLNGTVETPPGIDSSKFDQYFINWIESMGWNFCGVIAPYDEECDYE